MELNFDGDVNTLKQTGKYHVLTSATNCAFSNAAHMLVVIRCTDYVFQYAMDPSHCIVKVRSYVDRSGQTWKNWQEFSLTAIS